jgi:hypothetical protein
MDFLSFDEKDSNSSLKGFEHLWLLNYVFLFVEIIL